MISDRVKKSGGLPSQSWYAMAAGLLFLLLLAALVHVLNGQVAQAHLRQARYQATQTALSGCAANYLGAARRQCMAQMNAGLAQDSTYSSEVEMQADVSLQPPAGHRPPAESSGLAAYHFTGAALVRP